MAAPPPSSSDLSAAKRALLQKRLRGRRAAKTGATDIGRKPPDAPALASYGQQRLWYLHQLAPHSAAYNMHSAAWLRGPLDGKALERAVAELVRRHDVLRTTFDLVNDQLIQQAQTDTATTAATIAVHDMTGQPGATIVARATELAQTPFDLSTGPLFRAHVLRAAPDAHLFLFVVHHIVCDEWSNEIIWRELATLYSGGSLPDLPLSFVDVAYWQRTQPWSQDTDLAYWQTQLGGELPPLALPTDRPRPPQQRFNGAIVAQQLNPETISALAQLGQETGATLFMTLLSAFFLLLHRLTDRSDLTVGIPVTLRSRPEWQHLIGFFVNSLVMRTQVDPDATFRVLLAAVRQTALDGFAHQSMPFERLVEAMKPQREPGINPLFQVMMVQLTPPAISAEFNGLSVEPVTLDFGASKFDLTLFVSDSAESPELQLEYSSDLFDRATIERLGHQFQTLLASIVADPDTPLGQLRFMPDDECRLLRQWGHADTPPPPDRPLPVVIGQQAQRTPVATALIELGRGSDGKPVSYADLDRRANHLAHRLVSQGVAQGTFVGVCLERSADLFVALLAVHKAGCGYVPLDPTYPRDRLAFMQADSGARVVIANTDSASVVSAETTLLIDPHTADQPPDVPITLDTPAYMIYTSGSTGTPKGVVVDHRRLAHSTDARTHVYAAPVNRYLLLSPVGFDSSVAGIFWTLAQGGALVLPPPNAEQDASALATIIAQQRVTHTLMLPSLYQLLLEFADPEQLQSLQVVIVAGEACPLSLGQQHARVVPHAALYNEYGPTEGTVWSTVYRFPADGIVDGRVVPIGAPIPRTTAAVVDDRLRLRPVGVPGELVIGGAGVVDGYWQRSRLSAETFVPAPDGGALSGNGVLYRTGDRARWRADGLLEFLGRVDDQVKIRGHRIEPSEVEAVLQAHPLLDDAAVIARSVQEKPQLIAYVVAQQVMRPTVSELRAHVQSRLPRYMTPSAILFLDALPKTPNGKVDRRALPDPDPSSHVTEEAYAAPTTATQQTVAAIWAELLGVNAVGVHDDFFELGGHSLLVTRLIARLRRAFEHDLPLGVVLEERTIAGQAERIDTLLWAASGADATSGDDREEFEI